MEIKPIKGEVDYERALRRVEQLWASPKGSPEGDELDVLVTLIEAYEKENYPIDLPIRLRRSSSDWNRRGRTFDP